MNGIYFSNNNNNQNFNDNNDIKAIQNYSCYVPYADYYPMMNYAQNFSMDFNPFQKINNINNTQIQTTKETKENTNIMKIETDSELIQDLTGNYLEENKEESYNEKKQKEIEINLGQIIIDNNKLNDFPIINLTDVNKYIISVPEKILFKGEFFTAIKEVKKKEEEEEEKEEEKENEENEEEKDNKNLNEIIMEGVEEDNNKDKKIIIPENYLVNLNDNIKNNLKQMMNKSEISSCIDYQRQQLILKNGIVILYNKCLYIIEEIKKSVKHRTKKEKIKNMAYQLKNIIIFHNELRELFLSLNKKENNISEMNDNKEANYITYAEFYLQSKGGKTFKCEVCGMTFINHQTLGGHMSQYHRNVSEKYKKQNMIRKQREGQRQLLDYVKEKLFQKYNLDYRKLKKNDEKEKIKSFIKSHQKEYEILKRKIYREKAIKDSE